MAPLHLYCRHCRHQLTAKPLSSFHPMPSPDVDEMAEQWSCDAGCFFSFHPMPSPDVDEMAEQCSFHPMPSPDVDEMAEQWLCGAECFFSFHPMPSPDVDEMAEQWSCDAECCADAAARHLTLMFPLWACLSSLPSSSFHPMPSPDVDEMAEQWLAPSLSARFSSLLSAHLATPSAPNRLVLRSVCYIEITFENSQKYYAQSAPTTTPSCCSMRIPLRIPPIKLVSSSSAPSPPPLPHHHRPSPSLSACFSSLLSAHLATPSAPNRLVLRSVCSHKPVLLLVLLSAHTAMGWGVCGHTEKGREELEGKQDGVLSAHTAVGWGVCGHAEKGREEEEEEVLKGVDAGKDGEEEEWKETEGKEGGLMRVVKLMCKVVDSASDATREADEWGARGHAEDVYVMPVTASELQGCLNENSMLLPPTCREFNGFTVSFLQV
ncbi:unnamed protein product [Closterium sp. NIES-65]|nr:unnamed protein product [Closterium sp. NIES-65]